MSTYERINFLCKENHITGKEIGEKLGLKKQETKLSDLQIG